ncbi:NADP-specific glutamate dehydrogenase [Enterobacter cloacae]|nr:NADP-specific glutamate dehydrogenase [Enterobacter cloacae]CAD2023736.1 NADP-specific glutamate dehydrogenase [Enterobacter cloacae]CAH6255840.1 NADP-specific glutamate dehydrogenase [Enterobacter cloacae]CAH6258144.1 NADP-specific glutamate dehydrogenase [Enterobacter cloacae]
MSKISKIDTYNIINKGTVSELDLNKRITILTGYNGSGKTTLLKAIHETIAIYNDTIYPHKRKGLAVDIYFENSYKIRNFTLPEDARQLDLNDQSFVAKHVKITDKLDLAYKKLLNSLTRNNSAEKIKSKDNIKIGEDSKKNSSYNGLVIFPKDNSKKLSSILCYLNAGLLRTGNELYCPFRRRQIIVKGKSDGEIMRFCQALMTELYRHLGADTDVPAGDIGVGGREVGFMAGMMKKLSNNTACVFTGKGLSFGGSLIRPEATGYGLVYFTDAMLKRHGLGFEGMRVAVSGSGNVAQYAIEKAMALGARVITASDSNGTVVDEAGFTTEKLARLCQIKSQQDGRIADYAKEFGLTYLEGQQPWGVSVDIALPCATQNELDAPAARILIANGVKAVAEGANMPTTIEATDLFLEAGVLFAPGKAANAGGVATSGLEMAQNAARMGWKAEKVDLRLHHIMLDIHQACVEYGGEDKQTHYVRGANIAGFVKVADAMLAQGVL